MPHKVYILLGSNQGNPEKNLRTACNYIIENVGIIIKKSSLYSTAAWGNTQQEKFINQVILVQTEYNELEVLEQLLLIEKKMGRVRKEKWEPRVIDLDILFFDDLIVEDKRLVIPHPFLQERRFTLIPLNEIAAEFIHPVFQISVHQLLENCADLLEVEKI